MIRGKIFVGILIIFMMILIVKSDDNSSGPYYLIFHGMYADEKQFPWMAHLVIDKASICGGSLITSEWVLTAAHCIERAYEVTLSFGSINRLRPKLTLQSFEFKIHEDYQNYHDLGLIKLPISIEETEFIKPIPMPTSSMTRYSIGGVKCTIMGFGSPSPGGQASDVLLYTPIRIGFISKCPFFSALGGICLTEIRTDANVAPGDSGSALICNDKHGIQRIVGVAEGRRKNIFFGYGSYTSVMYHLDWIVEQTGVIVDEDDEYYEI